MHPISSQDRQNNPPQADHPPKRRLENNIPSPDMTAGITEDETRPLKQRKISQETTALPQEENAEREKAVSVFNQVVSTNNEAAAIKAPNTIEEELWLAAFNNQWELFENRIKDNPDVNIDVPPPNGPHNGITPLWLAAHAGKWELVKTMLASNHNANIDATPTYSEDINLGITPLWMAAGNNQWELVTTMLASNRNANIDATPTYSENINQGITPLWLAASNNQWELVKTMLASNPNANIDATPTYSEDINQGITPLWMAAQARQWELVKTMLASNPNADIDAMSIYSEHINQGITLLWLAALAGQWELVKAMLTSNPNANIDATPTSLNNNCRGQTPFWCAALSQQWEVVKTMLKNNSAVNSHISPPNQPSALEYLLQSSVTNAEAKQAAYACILFNRKNPSSQTESFLTIKMELEKSMERAIMFYNFKRDDYSESVISLLPAELQKACAIEVFKQSCVPIQFLSDKVLFDKLEEYKEAYNSKRHMLAISRICRLAYIAYIKNNALQMKATPYNQNFIEGNIKDLLLEHSVVYKTQTQNTIIENIGKLKEREITEENLSKAIKLGVNNYKILRKGKNITVIPASNSK